MAGKGIPDACCEPLTMGGIGLFVAWDFGWCWRLLALLATVAATVTVGFVAHHESEALAERLDSPAPAEPGTPDPKAESQQRPRATTCRHCGAPREREQSCPYCGGL